MILDKQDLDQILSLVDRYKKHHDEIARIEVTIKDFEKSPKMLHEDKDVVIKGIHEARRDEELLTKALTEKYGQGRINPITFEWMPEGKEKNEHSN